MTIKYLMLILLQIFLPFPIDIIYRSSGTDNEATGFHMVNLKVVCNLKVEVLMSYCFNIY